MIRFRYTPLVALCAVALAGCGAKPAPPEVDTVRSVKTLTVEPAVLMPLREFPGRVQASSSAQVSFRVAGTLVERPANAGQRVAKGDLLARLEKRDFVSRVDNVESSLQEANANLSAMQAGARPEEIRAMEADVAAAEATLAEAEAQLARMDELVQQGISARAELDTQTKARDVAKAGLASAQERLNSGRSGARTEDVEAQQARIRGLEAQLADAKSALDDTSLRAPFDGVVSRVFVENFEEVQAKQPIVSLQDEAGIEIVIDVPESAMAQEDRTATVEELAQGIEAEVEFSGAPGKRYPVTLKDYEAEADSVTQTFAVTFIMPVPDGINVRPGMTANVFAVGRRRTAAGEGFLVPMSAVAADTAGNPAVWKISPGTNTVSLAPVQLGSAGGENFEVLSGLAVGDRIAISAVNSLREGMTVRSLNENEQSSAE